MVMWGMKQPGRWWVIALVTLMFALAVPRLGVVPVSG